jgi:molybdopterin synthase catalytic subunit
MSMVARLEALALRPDEELRDMIERTSGDGAIVSFTGIARPASSTGVAVERLVLDHHPALTLRSLQEIAADALARFDVSHVHVVHRCGEIAPGEPIVFAGAASAHRRAAFDAADYLMDRLKTEAVFWKREVGDAGSRWVEPTEADYADRDRWG